MRAGGGPRWEEKKTHLSPPHSLPSLLYFLLSSYGFTYEDSMLSYYKKIKKVMAGGREVSAHVYVCEDTEFSFLRCLPK